MTEGKVLLVFISISIFRFHFYLIFKEHGGVTFVNIASSGANHRVSSRVSSTIVVLDTRRVVVVIIVSVVFFLSLKVLYFLWSRSCSGFRLLVM